MKNIFMLMLLTIAAKIAGFIKDVNLAYFYGVSDVTDAYFIAFTIPVIIFELIGTAIATGYIPAYSDIYKTQGTETANEYTNNIINLVLVMCTIILALVLIFTKPVVQVFASGFEGKTLDVAIKFTRVCIIGIYFSGVNYVLISFLQLKDNYVLPALLRLPMNLIIIISIIISVKTDVLVLLAGGVIALAFQTFAMMSSALKRGFRYKPILCVKDKYLHSMIYLTLPIILGSSATQINLIVDRAFASRIAIGGISALNYAQKLDDFIKGIFIASIVTVLYPSISKMVVEDNIAGLKKAIKGAISGVSIFVIPATIGAMVFSLPIVNLLFGRGAFGSEAAYMTADALFFYAPGIIGFGIRAVLTKAFYSLNDTKTPMINSFVAMGLNIILNIILSKYLGIGGLALSTSISNIAAMLLLFCSLRKKIGTFVMKEESITFLKSLLASSLMGLIGKLSFDYLTTNFFGSNLSVVIAIGIGGVFYFTAIWFMKISEVEVIASAVKKKLITIKSHAGYGL